MERSLGKNQPWFDKLTTNGSTHPPPFILSLSKAERSKRRMERSLGKNQPWFDKLTTNGSTHPPTPVRPEPVEG